MGNGLVVSMLHRWRGGKREGGMDGDEERY